MDYNELCGICLSVDGSRFKVSKWLRSKDEVNSISARRLHRKICEILETDASRTLETYEICKRCSRELSDIYSFVTKYEKSTAILASLKKFSIRLKQIKFVDIAKSKEVVDEVTNESEEIEEFVTWISSIRIPIEDIDGEVLSKKYAESSLEAANITNKSDCNHFAKVIRDNKRLKDQENLVNFGNFNEANLAEQRVKCDKYEVPLRVDNKQLDTIVERQSKLSKHGRRSNKETIDDHRYYECCSKKFPSLFLFRQHRRTNHNDSVFYNYDPFVFKIRKDDGLPQHICTSCLETFSAIHLFRENCKRIQTALSSLKHNYEILGEFEISEEYIHGLETENNEVFQVEQQPVEQQDNIFLFEGVLDESYVDDPVPEFNLKSSTIDENDLIQWDLEYLIPKANLESISEEHEKLNENDIQIASGDKSNQPINEKQADEELQCELCPSNFTCKRSLHQHVNEEHKSNGKFNKPCPICGKIFTMKKSYTFHIRTHDPSSRKFKCQYCEKRFMKSTYCKEHERTHTKERPFLCEECGSAFRAVGALRVHRNAHRGIRKKRPVPVANSRQCPEPGCEKVFNYLESLKKHIASRHRRSELGEKKYPFMCPDCPKGFAGADGLKKHMKMHGENRPYKCELCGTGFKKSQNFGFHMRVCHDKPKNFFCPHCNKPFTNKYQLNGHLVFHSDEKKYKCSECTAAFKTKQNLRIHNRIHTNERPHECVICRKSFIRQCELNAHHLKHTESEREIIRQRVMRLVEEESKSLKVTEPPKDAIET